jgi:S-adenosylmethionine:tRNA ribosyltransferase-isomerase
MQMPFTAPNPAEIRISDFTYTLPEERIAAFPLQKRDDSKLLVYKSGNIADDHFYNLPQRVPHNATLVVNNTRVIEARILFQKPSGGIIEIFCLEPHGTSIETALNSSGPVFWQCMVGGASKWKKGQVLEKKVADGRLTATYIGKEPDHFIIRFDWEPAAWSFAEVLHQAGAIPLPPYIKRSAQTDDTNRYQTVFAHTQGSVAAPTASLHFTTDTFKALSQKGLSVCPVTLHVGAGTFRPVKTETIAEHQMHAEPFQVTRQTLQALIDAESIVAAGTTSLRTLESLHWIGVKLLLGKYRAETELELTQWECYELAKEAIQYKQSLKALLQHLDQKEENLLFCRTGLIIVPGYRFVSATALITNFHQPQSTLLLLVAAFIGADWRKVYDHALANAYRFLSYGDSSLLYQSPLG